MSPSTSTFVPPASPSPSSLISDSIEWSSSPSSSSLENPCSPPSNNQLSSPVPQNMCFVSDYTFTNFTSYRQTNKISLYNNRVTAITKKLPINDYLRKILK